MPDLSLLYPSAADGGAASLLPQQPIPDQNSRLDREKFPTLDSEATSSSMNHKIYARPRNKDLNVPVEN